MKKRIAAFLVALMLLFTIAPISAFAATNLAAPKLHHFSSTADTITVRWGTVKGASGYKVYRKRANTEWERIKTTTATSYVDENLDGGGKYQYRVRAYKTVNGTKKNGVYSDTGYTRTLKATKAIYAGPGSDQENNSIDLSWLDIYGASYYQIKCKEGDATSWTKIEPQYDYSYYTYSGATHGKDCKFLIRAVFESHGMKTYGAYKTTSKITPHYAPKFKLKVKRDYGFEMIPNATKAGKMLKIRFSNKNGKAKLRIYTDVAHYFNGENETDYQLQLIDYNAYMDTKELIEKKYIDVPAGEYLTVAFYIKSDSTDPVVLSAEDMFEFDVKTDGVKYSLYYGMYSDDDVMTYKEPILACYEWNEV